MPVGFAPMLPLYYPDASIAQLLKSKTIGAAPQTVNFVEAL